MRDTIDYHSDEPTGVEAKLKYDDASWHSEGDFPAEAPVEYGGTHIGLFLRWCFLRGWVGQIHLDEWSDQVELVVRGEQSGTDFLFANCDGKFTHEDLNDEGNRFTSWYYGESGHYMDDYAENFDDQMYKAPEGAHDFEKFAAILERRYATFLARNSSAKKAGWNIWS